MQIAEIKNRWHNYFFQERPVEGIALFRILFGLLTLSTFWQDALRMDDFWGPYAIQSVATGMKNYNFPVLNIFQHFHMSYGLLYFFVALQSLALICFTIGYKTRIASIVGFILLVSFQQRTINMLSSADLLMRIMMMYMMFAPSAHAYSVDALLAKLKGTPLSRNYASWVHRLVQIQIAVVYVSTVIAKAKGETWLDGSAVYYATRLADLTRFPTPFILDWKWSLMLITWGTLIIEFALGTAIFIDEWRKQLIIFGIVFHLGIEYMMSIPTFEWLMIVGLLAMFKIDDYRLFDNWLRNKIQPKVLSMPEGPLKQLCLKALS
jgi:hypothetical protein